MAPRDFSKGKIYCIRNRAASDGIVYVGSSTQALCERMAQHRRNAKSMCKANYKIYKLMNEVGVEHFHIELITNYPCESKEELTREEGRHIRLLRPECNARVAGRTRKEHCEENREEVAAYKKTHDEAYYEAHKEAIAARQKAFYEANKEAIAARQKAYKERKKAERATVIPPGPGPGPTRPTS